MSKAITLSSDGGFVPTPTCNSDARIEALMAIDNQRLLQKNIIFVLQKKKVTLANYAIHSKTIRHGMNNLIAIFYMLQRNLVAVNVSLIHKSTSPLKEVIVGQSTQRTLPICWLTRYINALMSIIIIIHV